MNAEEIVQEVLGKEDISTEELKSILTKLSDYTKAIETDKKVKEEKLSKLQEINHDYFLRLHGRENKTEEQQQTQLHSEQVSPETIAEKLGGMIKL